MTNNEFFESFNAYQHEHLAFRTYYARTSYLKNHFLPDYGEVTPADVTSTDLDRIYDNMSSRRLASNAIFGMYAVLLSYFKLATKMDLTHQNPTSRS